MEMIKIDSSTIKEVGYNPTTQELKVIFKNGSEYLYEKVSEELFADFLKAPSKGSFFQKRIRPFHAVRNLHSHLKEVS